MKEVEPQEKPAKKEEIGSGSFRLTVSRWIRHPGLSDDLKSVEYIPTESADQ